MELKLTVCPESECDAPAEAISEDLWPSTDGGIVMAKVVGCCGHWFLMPADRLAFQELAGVDGLGDRPSG